MKKYLSVKTALCIGIGVILVYSLTGFFLVPFAGKKIIKSSIQDYLGRSSGIESLFFNPYTLETQVKNFEIKDTTGSPLFRFDAFYLNLSVSSLFRLAPVITGFEVERPEVFLVLNKNGELNISDLVEKPSAPPAGQEHAPKEEVFQFRLSNAGIKHGKIHFSDEIRGKTVVVDDLNLALPQISSMEGERKDPAQPAIQFHINNAPVEITAHSLPFDSGMDTRVQIKVKDLDLTPFEQYFTLPETVQLHSPGRLDFHMSGEYALNDANKEGLTDHFFSAKTKIRLKGLDIRTSESLPLLSLPDFLIEADSPDLFSRQIEISTIELNQARLNIARDEKGQVDLLGLFPAPEKETTSKSDLPDFHLSVGKAELNNAGITFIDESVAPPFKSTLSEFDIMVENLQAGPDGLSGAYRLGVVTEAGETLASKGKFSTAPEPVINGRLDLKGIIPEKYRPYYSPYGGKNLSIGKTDIGTQFKIRIKENTPVFTIDDGSIGLDDIRILGKNKTPHALDMKGLDLSGIRVDSSGQLIRVEQIMAENGRVNLIRDKTGNLNLIQRLSDITESVKKPGIEAPENQGTPPMPWTFELGQFKLESYNLAFSDFMPGDPVHLKTSDIMILAEDVNTAAGSKGRIKASMTFQDEGKIGINGSMVLSQPAAALNLNLGRIQVKPFQPYFTDYLNILISKGHIGSKGRLSISFSDPQDPKIRFTGQTTLNEFISKTKADGNDFFKCKSLYLSGIDISHSPVKVKIKEVSMTDFYQKTRVTKSGRLNYKDILAPKDKETSAPPSESPKPEIDIQTITLQGGHFNFADHYNTPGFIANMTEIGGTITGLSSSPDKGPADLRLKGIHGTHSPLDISGKIDPLKQEQFADLALSFKNIELPEFNAYSKKYLGYEIEKGKLVLDLKYHVEAGKLKSSNHIFFDQLTLGNSIDSPDATSLPVQLAISLLKNSNDEIELDVPIQGDLDDPEFSYGNVVFTTLSNLILGVVTAPFKFLGSLVGIGDDQDLGYVAFEYGSAVLDKENQAKLDQLIEILKDKETLNLEIEGKYNIVKDGERLRQEKYESLLISLLPEEARTRQAFEQLSPKDRDELIESAYELAQFPKPREKSGKEKEINLPEKEKLLITSIEIDKKAFNALGRSRGKYIRNYMVDSGAIAPPRIFLTEPDPVEKALESESRIKILFVLK